MQEKHAIHIRFNRALRASVFGGKAERFFVTAALGAETKEVRR